MKIEQPNQKVRPIYDLEHGDVFEYQGMPHIKTNIVSLNFGKRSIKCTNLSDGVLVDIPDDMMVKMLDAKVVIE